MNVLKALEKKKAIRAIINNKLNNIVSNIESTETLSNNLEDISSYIDTFFKLERDIDTAYNSVFISNTETIADVISYADCITKKIEILREILHAILIKETETKVDLKADADLILMSIHSFENLKNKLIDKIKDVCNCTPISNEG